MAWPDWIVNLLQALPTNANLQGQLAVCKASGQKQADEISRLKDDLRQMSVTNKRLQLQIEQLCPDKVDEADEFILFLMAGSEDNLIEPETIAEQCQVNRHEILLRLESLADNHYVAWSRNHRGFCYLTRRARIYLQKKGAFNNEAENNNGHWKS